MSWTEERVELLKRLWLEGKSASQIAKELGGVTRNAVIGKVHRLGLSNRNHGNAQQKPAADATPATGAKASGKAGTKGARAAEPAEKREAAPAAAAEAPSEPAPATASAKAPAAEPARPAIVPAGQPLPPQPSANEIPPEKLANAREVEKRALKLSLMELTERTCKWPVGDPATEDFWFCGLPSVPGKPYCSAHAEIAFQPASARRDRRR